MLKKPGSIRKLLRLAAQSAVTYDVSFKHYYLNKLRSGQEQGLDFEQH